MLIEKVINNNIVSAIDDEKKELVIMGKGIGFKAKSGQEIPYDKIEKVFRISSENLAEQFKELLKHMPLEHVKISSDIISYAKEHLKSELSQSIYVTLTDHIDFAINRLKNGIEIQNALLWEIKRFYPQEYKLGLYAVELINQRLQISFQEDEAGFIAIHFVNAEYGANISDTLRYLNLVKSIINITKKELNVELNETSLHYERFVTHIKFMLQRIYKNELLSDEEFELIQIIKRKYNKEYACSKIIAKYIQQETNTKLSENEVMYLAIHIRRVTQTDN